MTRLRTFLRPAAAGLVAVAVGAGAYHTLRAPAAPAPAAAAGVADRAAAPAPLALRPVRGFHLTPADREELLAHTTRWVGAKSVDTGVLIHAVRLNGLLTPADPQPRVHLYRDLLDAVLHDDVYRVVHGGLPLLFETPYGVGFRSQPLEHVGKENPFALDGAGGMTHVDKVLSTLGELGYPLTTPVTPRGGRKFTLADVLDDSLARWHPDRENEWTLLAYCDYLRDQREWATAAGARRSVDEVLRAVLDRKAVSPCFGTHRLYGLTKAIVRGRATPGFFSPALLAEAEHELRAVGQTLVARQWADGSWAPVRAGVPEVRPAGQATDDDYRSRLVITGHMLEWFAIAPDDVRPPAAVIVRAAEFTRRELLARPEAYMNSHFLNPTTHALRALCHLSDGGTAP